MTRKVDDRLAAIAYNLSTPGAWDGRDETNKLITDLLDDREDDEKIIAKQAEALKMAHDVLLIMVPDSHEYEQQCQALLAIKALIEKGEA